jgi:hypothetical protein
MKPVSRLLSALWIIVSGLMAGGVNPAFALSGNSLFETSALSHVSRDHYDAEGIDWARDRVEVASLIGPRRALLGGSGFKPALSLPFYQMSTGADLSSRGVTYSGPGNKTQYDSTGKLTYAPNNLIPNSTSSTWWSTGKSAGTTVTGGQVDPFGGALASQLTFGAQGDFAGSNIATLAASNYINSLWVQGNASGTIHLFDASHGAWNVSVPVTTTWTRVDTGSIFIASGRIIAIQRGSGDLTQVNVYAPQLEAVTYQTTPRTYVATTSATYYGPRFDYRYNATSGLWEAAGLLIEEVRTNLATYSGDYTNAAWTRAGKVNVTANAILAPDGTTTAQKLSASVSASDNYQTFQIGKTITSGSAYTASEYFKAAEYTFGILNIYDGTNKRAWFNLSTGTVATTDAGVTATITSVGGGWYRCTATATAGSTSGGMSIEFSNADNVFTFAATAGSGVYAYGTQYELGSFATSYIPDTSAAVTRAADYVSMTGTAFSSWYNQAEGTWVVEADSAKPSGGSAGVFVVSDNTGNERMLISHDLSGTNIESIVISGAVPQADIISAGSTTTGSAYKTALAYKANDIAAVTAGGTVGTDTSATIPTVNRLDFGFYYPGLSSSNILNGHIKSLDYYRTRLPNPTLVTKSTP